jgi:hypothetical protein
MLLPRRYQSSEWLSGATKVAVRWTSNCPLTKGLSAQAWLVPSARFLRQCLDFVVANGERSQERWCFRRTPSTRLRRSDSDSVLDVFSHRRPVVRRPMIARDHRCVLAQSHRGMIYHSYAPPPRIGSVEALECRLILASQNSLDNFFRLATDSV